MEVPLKPRVPFNVPPRALNLNRKLPALAPSQVHSEVSGPDAAPSHSTPRDALSSRVLHLETAMAQRERESRQLARGLEEARAQNAELQRQVAALQQQMARLQARPAGSDALDFQTLAKDLAQDEQYVYGKNAIDLSKIQRFASILNQVATDTPLVVKSDGGGAAKLQRSTPIDIAFYRNGVHVEDTNFKSGQGGMHKFMPYSSSGGQAFVGDLLQGFLPAEFQILYPQGVRLNIVDRGTEVYTVAIDSAGKAAAGSFASAMRSRRITGSAAGAPQANSPTIPNEHSIASEPLVHNAATETSSKSVDRGVDPRRPPKSYRPVEVKTAKAKVSSISPLTPRLISLGTTPVTPSPASGVRMTCTIKVRSDAHLVILTLYVVDTVATLKRIIGQAIGQDPETFEVLTVNRKILGLDDTMEQANVVPNGTLFLQRNRC